MKTLHGLERSKDIPNTVEAVCFSSDDTYALSGSADHTLILWDVKSGKAIRTFKGHSDSVDAVCLSSDDKYVLSGSYDKTLILWDVESGEILRRLYVKNPVKCLSVEPRWHWEI